MPLKCNYYALRVVIVVYLHYQTITTNAGEHKRTTTMKFQIRTNSANFGDTFGVYIFDKPKFEYTKNEAGEKIKTQIGIEAGFVKQTEFSHGTFEMEHEEVKKLTKKLSDNCRNCWVKLYIMEG